MKLGRSFASALIAAGCGGATIGQPVGDAASGAAVVPTCDAISIGLGFDASAVLLGPVAPPEEPIDDPCSGVPAAEATALV